MDENMTEFQPQIVAFCCSHCAYNAADLAGSLRIQYPPSIKIIEVLCSGRVDVVHILRAFEDGADGVMVAG
jgi:F420-non-reducing hydrogenase iron-sulfur subunit